MRLAGPLRLRTKTRSAYYPVRVLGDLDAEQERVRGAENAFALAAERLTTKPPLCQECAKTGKHSPTIRGQGGQELPADLGISRRHSTL
ncbi:MAG TPA: hypothetical protein VN306_01620 [Mycobacterium sp.]|nr:hypothetical protein [Mycobacterium sp.]